MKVRQSIKKGFFLLLLIFWLSFNVIIFFVINLFKSVYEFMCVYVFSRITMILEQYTFTLIQYLFFHLEVL